MRTTPPQHSARTGAIDRVIDLAYRNAVLVLAVIVIALWVWRAMTPRQLFATEQEQTQFLSSVGAPPSTRIITLGTEWCPACKQLEHQLTSDNIPHLALDVEEDAAGRDLFRRVAEITGSNSIPKIILDKDIVSRPKLFMELAGDE